MIRINEFWDGMDYNAHTADNAGFRSYCAKCGKDINIEYDDWFFDSKNNEPTNDILCGDCYGKKYFPNITELR